MSKTTSEQLENPQIFRFPHSAENTNKNNKIIRIQERWPIFGAGAKNRCRRHQQAKKQTRHKQQHKNAPIKQSAKQSGNQAISKPQQQLASQYRNQSVGRMARRKKLTTTSPVELWQVGTPCSQEPTQLTDRPTANQPTS
jgi:hypothetical protein